MSSAVVDMLINSREHPDFSVLETSSEKESLDHRFVYIFFEAPADCLQERLRILTFLLTVSKGSGFFLGSARL